MRSTPEATHCVHRLEPAASGTPAGPQRRHVLAGLGVAGAAGMALATLPLARQPEAAALATAPEIAPETGGGYRLSEHVRRYYQTARV